MNRYQHTMRYPLLVIMVPLLILATAALYVGINSLTLLDDTKNIIIKGLVTKTKLLQTLDNEISTLNTVHDNEIANSISSNLNDHQNKIKMMMADWRTLASEQDIQKIEEFISIFAELRRSLENILQFNQSNSKIIAVDLEKSSELLTVAMQMVAKFEDTVVSNKIYVTTIPRRIMAELIRVKFDKVSLISLSDISKLRQSLQGIDYQLQNIDALINSLYEKIAPDQQNDVKQLKITWETYVNLYHKIQNMILTDGTILSLPTTSEDHHQFIEKLKQIITDANIENNNTMIAVTKYTHAIYSKKSMIIAGFMMITVIGIAYFFIKKCWLWRAARLTTAVADEHLDHFIEYHGNTTINHLLETNWHPILDHSHTTPDEILAAANSHKTAGRLEEARDLLSFLLTRLPDHTQARVMLIYILMDSGCHAVAILYLEKIMAVSGASELLAECYRNVGLIDRATELMQQILFSNATLNHRWLSMTFGQMLIETQRLDEALNIFIPLIARSELIDVARTIVADVMFSRGQFDNAFNMLQPIILSSWSRTFVLKSLIQLRLTMVENGIPPARRPHPYPGTDLGISLGSISYYGRFGHQLYDYFFLRCQAERVGITLETPEWVGHYIFELDDPLPTGRRIPVKRLNTWIEDRVASEDTNILIGRDFFSPGGFSAWKPEYTLRAREIFRLRPYCLSKMMSTINWLRQRGETIIAIHIRRTDQELAYRLPSNEWYLDWLRSIWKTLPNPILYVASDDLNAVRNDFAEFNPFTWPDVKDENVAPGLEWLQDFIVLMHANAVAISQSSFSHWSCMLNTTGNLFVQPDMEKECLVPYSPLLQNFCPVVPNSTRR